MSCPPTPTQNLPQPQVNRPELTWANLVWTLVRDTHDLLVIRGLTELQRHQEGLYNHTFPRLPHRPHHLRSFLPSFHFPTSLSTVHSACFTDTQLRKVIHKRKHYVGGSENSQLRVRCIPPGLLRALEGRNMSGTPNQWNHNYFSHVVFIGGSPKMGGMAQSE